MADEETPPQSRLAKKALELAEQGYFPNIFILGEAMASAELDRDQTHYVDAYPVGDDPEEDGTGGVYTAEKPRR